MITKEGRPKHYDSGEPPLIDSVFLAMLKNAGWSEFDPELLANINVWSPSARPSYRDIAGSHRRAFLRQIGRKDNPPPVSTADLNPIERKEYEKAAASSAGMSSVGIEDLLGDLPMDGGPNQTTVPAYVCAVPPRKPRGTYRREVVPFTVPNPAAKRKA